MSKNIVLGVGVVLVLCVGVGANGGAQTTGEGGKQAQRVEGIQAQELGDYGRIVVLHLGKPGGYFDRMTGKPVLGLENKFLFGFSEGLCPVWDFGAHQDGYIDRRGNYAFPPRFAGVLPFSEGRAVVDAGDAGYGVIDKQGEWVAPAGKYEAFGSYSDGLCAFRTGDRWGFLDRDGKAALKARYTSVFEDLAPEFHDGLALMGEGNIGRCYIDTKGRKLALPKGVEAFGPFSEGLASVLPTPTPGAIWKEAASGKKGHEGKSGFGFISRAGKMVIEMQFASAGDFSEGLAAASLNDGRFVYDPDSGYDLGKPRVAKGGAPRWGFIDGTGKVAIPMDYEMVGPFKEGLARVMKDGKWGYIDRMGKMAIAPELVMAWDFKDGLAKVLLADKTYGFVDMTGKMIIRTGVEKELRW